MPNQKYSQVTTLVTAGKFRWASDPIVAVLTKNVVFDVSHLTFDQVAQPAVASVPVLGRWLSEDGACMGQPVFFQKVAGDQDYQVLLCQDAGGGRMNLLAFFDRNAQAQTIRLANNGTLVVRPVEVDVAVPPVTPVASTTGLWLRL